MSGGMRCACPYPPLCLSPTLNLRQPDGMEASSLAPPPPLWGRGVMAGLLRQRARYFGATSQTIWALAVTAAWPGITGAGADLATMS